MQNIIESGLKKHGQKRTNLTYNFVKNKYLVGTICIIYLSIRGKEVCVCVSVRSGETIKFLTGSL